MTCRLSNTDTTIMAAGTITGDAHVVKRRTSKVREVLMAHGAIRSGWQVIKAFSITDHIVMAGFTVINDTCMIIAASAKGPRAVTSTTILSSLQVVERFTARCNTMTGRAIVQDVRMVDECTSETLSVVARSTIGRGSRVGGHRRCFSWRVNTITIIVA